jgi:DnaJ-class molecular chaperone
VAGARAGGAYARPARGRDIEQPVDITLEEAYRGSSRTMQLNDERIEIKIPRGVKTGSRVRVAGKGEPGRNGGKPGDLYLKINVLPHAQFQREGDNLRLKLPVDLYTMLLGGEVQVPTLDRPLILNIPPETQNGKVFRLRGKGMPNVKKPDQHGDLYVEAEVLLPTNLTEQEKTLFRQLRALRAGV